MKIVFALLAALALAQDYLQFLTQISFNKEINQRDGLNLNLDLFTSSGEYLELLFICNTCTFSYYFSDGPY